MDVNSASYKLIYSFIKINGYTWTVEDVLKDYEKYYKKGYYVSYTMEHIIKNNETAILVLLGEAE